MAKYYGGGVGAGGALPPVSPADNGSFLQVISGVWDKAGAPPFKGTFFMNPAYTGVSTGSQANPYKTIAAAFAAMVALGLPGGIVYIPPSTTVTENVTFPSTGGQWEIGCPHTFTLNQASTVSRIVGNIVATNNSAAVTVFALSNLFLLGNITGDSASTGLTVLELNDVRQTGSVALTKTGTGAYLGSFKGVASPVPNKLGGSTTGTVSVPGAIIATNWVFEGGTTDAPASTTNPPFYSFYSNCQFGSVDGVPVPMGLNGAAGTTLYIFDSTFTGPTTFTAAAANYTIQIDASCLTSLTRVGLILSGTGIQLKTLNANASNSTTVVGNVGSTAYSARNPEGLYEVVFDMTLLAAGTAGLLQLNVIYTDMTGTLVTIPVGGTLNIAGAVGTKQQASLCFRHNGAAAPIAYSLTGVVTPGTMSVAFSTAIQRRN